MAELGSIKMSLNPLTKPLENLLSRIHSHCSPPQSFIIFSGIGGKPFGVGSLLPLIKILAPPLFHMHIDYLRFSY